MTAMIITMLVLVPVKKVSRDKERDINSMRDYSVQQSASVHGVEMNHSHR